MADKVDEAFALTTKLLFGKPLSPLARYSEWMKSRVSGGKSTKSVLGDGTAFIPEYGFFRKIPEHLVVSFENLQTAAERKIESVEGDETIASIAKKMKSFAFFVPTFAEGRNLNVENTAVYIDCLNIRDSFDPFTSKNCAHDFSIMDSEALFGCHRVIKSSFSIHCYNCVAVQRCLEMDFAKSCTDSLFCHNVENLDNCMFCFNTKSKRYAIGNIEVGKERYLQMKQQIVGEMVRQLETNGKLDFDIYDILAKRTE
ncbi:MAG: hypothetical protein QW568_00020 [Candidatus Anstonellaceae archaeon]